MECWILDTGYWILDTGYWILDTGYWILDVRQGVFFFFSKKTGGKSAKESLFLPRNQNPNIWR